MNQAHVMLLLCYCCFCKTAQVLKMICRQGFNVRETLNGSGAPTLDWIRIRLQSVTEVDQNDCCQAPAALVLFQCGFGSTQEPFTCVKPSLNVTPAKHRKELSNNDM